MDSYLEVNTLSVVFILRNRKGSYYGTHPFWSLCNTRKRNRSNQNLFKGRKEICFLHDILIEAHVNGNAVRAWEIECISHDSCVGGCTRLIYL